MTTKRFHGFPFETNNRISLFSHYKNVQFVQFLNKEYGNTIKRGGVG